MPREFNPEADRSTFRLPPRTRQEIVGLMLDLDLDATAVVVRAVRELWEREVADEKPRDVLTELDELKARMAALERSQEAS